MIDEFHDGNQVMNSPAALETIWTYTVRDGYLDAFLRAYSPGGEWARLFRKCQGYLGTDLKQDVDDPMRFMTIDSWQSYAAFARMRKALADDYDELDRQCEAYTLSERHVGVFRNR